LVHNDGEVGSILAIGFIFTICDQRLSTIEQMRDSIMMGQLRQTRKAFSVEDDFEEEKGAKLDT
jgi:hypothetical protein